MISAGAVNLTGEVKATGDSKLNGAESAAAVVSFLKKLILNSHGEMNAGTSDVLVYSLCKNNCGHSCSFATMPRATWAGRSVFS